MARYIKRYITGFILVFLVLSILVFFIHVKSGVKLDGKFLSNAFNIVKYNLNFIFFTTLFLSVFYFFQTRELDSIKALVFAFLILSVINSVFISVYLFKPRSKDVSKYMVINPSVRYRFKLYKDNDVLLGKDYLVRYENFNKKTKRFSNLTAVNLKNGAQYISKLGYIVKKNGKYFLMLASPFSVENNARVGNLGIHVFENVKINPFFKKTFSLYHTVNAKYLFYNHLLSRQKNKKNIWHYLNTLLIVMGINAVFMIFGLFYTIESHRIVNIAISISMIPFIYTLIYFIYKIPFNKISFLNKGFLIRINFGVLMFVLAIVLFVPALFRVRYNSQRGA